VTTHIGETIEANDNIQQLPDSPGGAVGSITNFSLTAVNETPTLRLGFGTDLGVSGFTGPGAQSSLDGFRGDVRGSVDKATKLTDYHFDGFWRLAPAAVSELTDSGILAANTTNSTLVGNAGLKHQLNGLNAFGWSISGTRVDFSGNSDGLSPYTDLVMTESWIRNLSSVTDFTLATSTQWYQADNATDTETWVQTLTGQIDTQLTSRLKLMGRAGGGVVHTTEQLVAPFEPMDFSDTSGNFIAAAALVYDLKNTTISADASHDFAPSSLGQVQDRTAVGFAVDHKINEWSGLLFRGQFFDQLPSTSAPGQNDRRQAVILSLAYSRNLMRDWDLLVSYRFVQQEENTGIFIPFDDGASTSNAVFVTVNRNVTLFR
jgi:hypothetical protein